MYTTQRYGINSGLQLTGIVIIPTADAQRIRICEIKDEKIVNRYRSNINQFPHLYVFTVTRKTLKLAATKTRVNSDEFKCIVSFNAQ